MSSGPEQLPQGRPDVSSCTKSPSVSRRLAAPNLRTSRRAGSRSHSQDHCIRQRDGSRGGQGYPHIHGQRSASTHPLSPGGVIPVNQHASHAHGSRFARNRVNMNILQPFTLFKREEHYPQHTSARQSATTRRTLNLQPEA